MFLGFLISLLVQVPATPFQTQDSQIAAAETVEESNTFRELTAGLDALFQDFHEAGQFNGSVVVILEDNFRLARGYGYADLSEVTPNRVDTRYRIASVSKVFTALAIMSLVEDGLLALDAPVGTYLQLQNTELADEVTVRQLLSHTSGLKREAFDGGSIPDAPLDREGLLTAIQSSEFIAASGERYSYSNAGYVLLRLIAEAAADSRFDQIVRERVIEPAGLGRTGFLESDTPVEGLADGFDVLLGERIAADSETAPENMWGAGGMYSTALDLAALDLALLRGQVLAAEVLAEMERPHPPGRGLGWPTLLDGGTDEASNPSYGLVHNGDYSGTNVSFIRFPDARFAVVMVSNQDRMARNELFQGVAALVNGGEAPQPTPNLLDSILQLAIDNGPETALAETERLAAETGTPVLPHAFRTLAVGNALVRIGRDEDARKIFEFMTLAYPGNALGYLALGTTYENASDIQTAVRWYCEVLTFEPGNQFATAFLERLDTPCALDEDDRE